MLTSWAVIQMRDLDKRTWDIYIKRNNLTINELSNPELCKELIKTTEFAATRFSLSVRDFIATIKNSIK